MKNISQENIYFLEKTRNQKNHSFLQKRDLPYKRNGSGRYFRPKTLKTHFSCFCTKNTQETVFLRSGALLSPKFAQQWKNAKESEQAGLAKGTWG